MPMDAHHFRAPRPSVAPPRAKAKTISSTTSPPGTWMRSPAIIWESACTCTSTPGVPCSWPLVKRSGVSCRSSFGDSASAVAERVTSPMKAILPFSSAGGRKGTKAAEKDGLMAPAFSAVTCGSARR